jgi:hypothetical protein
VVPDFEGCSIMISKYLSAQVLSICFRGAANGRLETAQLSRGGDDV